MDYLDPDSESSPLAAGSPLAPDDAPPPPAGFKPVAVKPPEPVVPPPPQGFKPIPPKPDGGISGGIDKQVRKAAGADRDPDVDYATGAPWNVQLALARSSRPDEAKSMLEYRVGKGNAGQDAYGNWWVKIDGKKVAVRPKDASRGPPPADPFSKEGLTDFVTGRGLVKDVQRLRSESPGVNNAVTDFAATSPEMAGAAGGALAGAAGGPPGMMIGAGLGAAAGKAADTGEKAAEGTLRGTLKENALDIAKEGAFNASLQGAGTVAGGALKGAGNWLKTHMFGITPEIAARTRWLLSNDATPPIQVVAPGAKAAAVDQQLRNILSGDPRESANVRYLIKGAREIIAADDVPPEVIEQSMRELMAQDTAMSGTPVGRNLQEAAQSRYGELRSDIESSIEAATNNLRSRQDALKAYADGWSGRLGENVADSFEAARGAFDADFKRAYQNVDAIVGNRPLIPVGPFRDMARRIQLDTPPNMLTPRIEALANDEPTRKMTFSEWHDLRSALREKDRNLHTNLTPGVRAHRAGEAAQAANSLAYDPSDEIARQMDETDLFGLVERQSVPPEALEELKKVDAAYKKGIAQFNNATMNKLVKDARDGLFVDPNYVSKMLVAPGYTEQTRMLMSHLSQESKDQVARADLHNLVTSATDPNTGMVDGKILRNILADPSRKRVMKEVYDPAILRQASQLADELAALNGDIDVRSIKEFSGPGIQRALQTAIQKQTDLKEFVKNGVLNHLIDAKPEVVDAAADHILSGRKEFNLERVRDFLGEYSVAWFNLRQYAKKKVLYNAVVERPDKEKTIAGKAIEDVLSKLTEREQDLLFPNGEKEDLKMIAVDAKSLFPRANLDFGTSLAARAIQLRLPFHIRADAKWAESKFVGYLTQHPALLHWLADSERARPGSFKILAAPIMRWAANAGTSGPGQGAAPPENPTQGIYGGGL